MPSRHVAIVLQSSSDRQVPPALNCQRVAARPSIDPNLRLLAEGRKFCREQNGKTNQDINVGWTPE
jgi:hypothetical protein